MLRLLLKTRFRYYFNYLRHHLDRITAIEIGVIVSIFLLLLGRSPADIGYDFRWLNDPTFFRMWLTILTTGISVFYVLAITSAWHTLRPTDEWSLLVSSAFSNRILFYYFLIRQFLKLAGFYFIALAPIIISAGLTWWNRLLLFMVATGYLTSIQTGSFYLTYFYRIRMYRRTATRIIWLMLALTGAIGIAALTPVILRVLSNHIIWQMAFAIFLNVSALVSFLYLRTSFRLPESRTVSRKRTAKTLKTAPSSIALHSPASILISKDLYFILREKKSFIWIPIVSNILLLITGLSEEQSAAAYLGFIAVQCVLYLLFVTPALSLFENDAEHAQLLRILPLTSKQFWWARWTIMTLLLILIALPSALLLPIRHPIDMTYGIFILAVGLLLPGVTSILYCNAGFGLFPHIRLSGTIMSLSFVMMILFWFYMPFGTIILLIPMLKWVRKSQCHFSNLELS
ncbi:hypothetical protein JW960_19500 [candidate division KSB1 bacterium]|nr:hypothetical protein [candidate division KSB1 bacterium]